MIVDETQSAEALDLGPIEASLSLRVELFEPTDDGEMAGSQAALAGALSAHLGGPHGQDRPGSAGS
jgi:hypothetical protein